MLHVSDDNNDELFRRAADNYPLRTDNPDWEALFNKVNAGISSSTPEIVAPKRKNYRFLVLLLLLFPLAIFENKIIPVNSPFPAKKDMLDKTGNAIKKKQQPGNFG
jgi:hypothetical protein